jgi:uncharacterized protein YjbI with pentapeptide repeats
MEKTELIERWLLPANAQLRQNVVRCLLKGLPLAGITGLGRINGRFDLRGLKPRTDHEMGFFTLKKQLLCDVDLSYAVFENITFKDLTLQNALCQEAKFDNCFFEGTHWADVVLRRTEFGVCRFEHLSRQPGSFRNVFFDDCDINTCFFHFPSFEHCVFKGRKIKYVDFGGGAFKNCRFEGKLQFCSFRGYPQHEETKNWLMRFWTGYIGDPKKYWTKGSTIDFIDCDLRDTDFMAGFDVSQCRFRASDRHLYVKNWPQLYTEAKKIIEEQWQGEHRTTALDFLTLNFNAKKVEMVQDYLDVKPPKGKYNDTFVKFYNMLHDLNAKM